MEMQGQMPAHLDAKKAKEGTFARNDEGQMTSLDIVLLQELERFNKLLSAMKKSLKEIEKAIKGIVVMSSDLELMFNAITNNQVPELWTSVAYPCLKPLASWAQDFLKRISFMRSWLEEGLPNCYWLSGLFFPQGFLTGVLQTHARKYQIPIDTLNFGFDVLPQYSPEDVVEGAEDGVYINGIFIDGARWNDEKQYLEDAKFGEMYSSMPVIHFKPIAHYEHPAAYYESPLYKVRQPL